MQQSKATTQFISDDGKAKVFVENDMPIGIFHDFLMELKGLMVERMITAHKQQVEEMDEQRKIDEQSRSEDENLQHCNQENCE